MRVSSSTYNILLRHSISLKRSKSVKGVCMYMLYMFGCKSIITHQPTQYSQSSHNRRHGLKTNITNITNITHTHAHTFKAKGFVS